VIAEEREDLIENTGNSDDGTKQPKGANSEINELVQEQNIDIGHLSSVYNYPNTEENHELMDKFSQMQDDKEEADYIEGLQAVLDDDETTFLDGIYFKELRKGYISLEFGINSVCIPVDKNDVGSLIAYSLSTNWYYEGLARQNYMEFQSKIDQNSGEEINMNGAISSGGKNSANNDNKEFIEKKPSSDNSRLHGLQNQLHNVKAGNETKKKEQIILNDKTDVLDSEYQPHHIESEFLSYEKINFKHKWHISKVKDMKMKVFKNVFWVDHIHGNIQEYIHKDKNLDNLVFPKYSKNFLEDENIMNYYGELNEIKKMLEMQSTQTKYFQRRYPQDNISMDNISETSYQKKGYAPREEVKAHVNRLESESKNSQFNYNVASPSPRNYNKIANGDQSMSNLNLTGIPDLVITPVQPPIQQINDKYRAKKVFVVLSEEDLDFEVTIYFPKKFEALRKFYWGSHEDFIKSIMKTCIWGDNSGGKTKGKFFKSGDEKYIIKEIRSGDIRMFTEFAPRYFDYLCKSFFHNFPWALAKILGAYKISIKSNGKNKTSEKKYYVITENLNYGISNEKHIIRYDLKGKHLDFIYRFFYFTIKY
jgi:hypothetical protein